MSNLISKPIRFPFSSFDGDNLGNFLIEIFGVNPIKLKNEWVVDFNDPALISGIPKSIFVGKEIDLNKHSLNYSSEYLSETIPTVYDDHLGELPKNVPASNWNGRFSEIEKLNIYLTFLERKNIPKFLRDKVLPFLKSQFGVQHITPIFTDPSQQQLNISIFKMLFLIEKYGIVKARELSLDKNVLSDILPDPLEIIGYPEVFTIFNPIALSLTLSRRGVAWHLYSDKEFRFVAAEQNNILSQFQTSIDIPKSDNSIISEEFLSSLKKFPVRKYIVTLGNALNNMLGYLYDIRNFLTEGNQVDFQKQVRSNAAIKLIFMDLKSLSISNTTYNLLTYSMAAIDKIANLIRHIGSTNKKEKEIFKLLFSNSQKEKLLEIFRKKIKNKSVKNKILQWLLSYDRLHIHIAAELNETHTSEFSRLEWLYGYRNLKQHGAHLLGDQFDQLFMQSRGEVPVDLPIIAKLLMLGFMLSPEEFLKFIPKEKS